MNDIKELSHINPNCIDAKYCEPHGEKGEVYYSSKNVRDLIKQREREAVEGFVGEYLTGELSDGDWLIVLDKYKEYKLSQTKGDK